MRIADVRAAFAEALNSIDGLRASEYITDQITPPHAMFDYTVEPDLTFGRGADVYRFTISVFAARTAERASQIFLDLLRDPASDSGVKRTIEDHPAVAAVVDYARVTSIGAVGISEANNELLVVEFQVEVVL